MPGGNCGAELTFKSAFAHKLCVIILHTVKTDIVVGGGGADLYIETHLNILYMYVKHKELLAELIKCKTMLLPISNRG